MDGLLRRSLAGWSEKSYSSNDLRYLEKFAPVWRGDDSQFWKPTDIVQDKVGEGNRLCVACVGLCCVSVSLSGCSCRRHQRRSHWHSAQPIGRRGAWQIYLWFPFACVVRRLLAVCLLWMLRCRFLKDKFELLAIHQMHSPGSLRQSASEGFTLEAAPSALQPSIRVRKGRNLRREGSLSPGWADMQKAVYRLLTCIKQDTARQTGQCWRSQISNSLLEGVTLVLDPPTTLLLD